MQVPEALQDKRPNIILIITDQWRGDALSCSGHPVAETPNLDALARRGANFTAAYTPCPSCIAARASIFTGQRPTTHGRIGYRDCVPWRYENTLAEVMRDAGYQTACVGKTHFYPQRAHLGFEMLESYEAAQNFDGLYVNDYHEWLREQSNGAFEEEMHGVDWNSWYARPSHLPEELHNNTWVATRGIDFMRRRDPVRPFFLNLSFHRPHPPIDPPRVFWDIFADRELPPVPVGDWADEHDMPVSGMNDWRGRLDERLLDRCRRAYYAQIAHIDNQIGRLVMSMRTVRPGPTWIIFTSDHGEMLGDHHMFRKTYAYEGSAKAPMIVCPPAGTSVSVHETDAPVSLEDVMPTVLDAAGVDVPDTVEGRSMLPLLTRSPAEAKWRDYVHGEHSNCYAPDNAFQYVTDGKEKFVWNPHTGREQFFDMTDDPQETRNRAADPAYAERVSLWRSRLVDELRPREQDGMTDGRDLVTVESLPAVRPELLEY